MLTCFTKKSSKLQEEIQPGLFGEKEKQKT